MGPEFASLLWLKSLFRSFGNRRQVAAYAGLAPSPGVERDQGIFKSGNRRLRHTMIELAWFWLRHRPDSALSRWFQARVGDGKGRVRRIAIVALARKLLVALWCYVTNCSIFESKRFPQRQRRCHCGAAIPAALATCTRVQMSYDAAPLKVSVRCGASTSNLPICLSTSKPSSIGEPAGMTEAWASLTVCYRLSPNRR